MSAAADPAARPRVVLVEDDAAIRQFVAMALEDHALELVACPTLAAARQALAEAPVVLVLLDMMLPDGSGLDLLRDADLRRRCGSARWVIFSAGVSPATKAQLGELQVERLLHKPVSLSMLSDCVDEALAAAHHAAASPPTPAAPADKPEAANPAEAPDGSAAAQAHAVEMYFEGDRTLFAQMQQHASLQFSRDAAAGDAALAAGDLPALRRVAHSLKTILRMLGHPQASQQALELENMLAAGEYGRWPQLWAALRRRITEITDA
jgi:DNA-binding response OmpR family regulator